MLCIHSNVLSIDKLAMNLDCTVVSTNCNTGPNEILKNGKLGKLIELGDYFSLKREIEYFYNNKNSIKIKNKIKNGFKCIQRFNYEKNCQKYQYIVNKHL